MTDCIVVLSLFPFLAQLGYTTTNCCIGNVPTDPIDCIGTRITRIDLNGAQLNTRLSPGIANLDALETLDLSATQLLGPLPIELFSLTNLKVLRLNGNKLMQPIPVQIQALVQLQILDLSRTNLTGPIPDGLGNLPSLQTLELSNNQLTSFPQILNLQSLQSLGLSNNRLSQAPSGLNKLLNLRALDLSGNPISGQIAVSPNLVICSLPNTVCNTKLPQVCLSSPLATCATPTQTPTDVQQPTNISPIVIFGPLVGVAIILTVSALFMLYKRRMNKWPQSDISETKPSARNSHLTPAVHSSNGTYYPPSPHPARLSKPDLTTLKLSPPNYTPPPLRQSTLRHSLPVVGSPTPQQSVSRFSVQPIQFNIPIEPLDVTIEHSRMSPVTPATPHIVLDQETSSQ